MKKSEAKLRHNILEKVSDLLSDISPSELKELDEILHKYGTDANKYWLPFMEKLKELMRKGGTKKDKKL